MIIAKLDNENHERVYLPEQLVENLITVEMSLTEDGSATYATILAVARLLLKDIFGLDKEGKGEQHSTPAAS